MGKTLQAAPAIYELTEILGQGANGSVYKAVRRDTNRQIQQTVAIKILNSKKSVEIWRREFESLAQVNSPYCVRVFGFEWIDDCPALVLEWIDGVTLAELRKAFLINEKELRYILGQALRGLEALRDKQMCHGDLSPNNILIDRSGSIRLVDFGFGNTAAGRRRVTVEFAAPEVLAGAEPGYESDLCSLSKIAAFLSDHQITDIAGLRNQNLKLAKLSLQSKVRKLQDHRRKRLFSTQVWQTKSNWTPRIRNFILAVIALFVMPASVSVSAPRPLGEAQVKIRSQFGLEIIWQGRSIGFAPLDLLHLSPGRYELQWRAEHGVGHRSLTLEAGDSIVLDDNEFSDPAHRRQPF